jgi:hypothetical protein
MCKYGNEKSRSGLRPERTSAWFTSPARGPNFCFRHSGRSAAGMAEGLMGGLLAVRQSRHRRAIAAKPSLDDSADEPPVMPLRIWFDMLSIVTETAEIITDAARWAVLQRKVQAGKVAQVFRLFRDNGIEPVLIKGFAADQYYPSDVFRPSIDVDLAVSAADFEKAENLGATADGMAIDLHRELRHLDTLPWADLFENTRLIDTEGTQIRVLRPEDHLRVLAVHWLNDGGINREKLWDVYYLIADRGPDLEWNRALDVVPANRRRWIECTILLAHKYLGLDLKHVPIEADVNTLPKWLTSSIERSWADPPKEIPLWLLTRKPAEFAKQLKLRLAPNPVRATVEMEGDFDSGSRFFYRFGNFFQRLLPSVRRNVRALDK